MSVHLPPPEYAKLPDGKERWLYRDLDGHFISKTEYERLRKQLASGQLSKEVILANPVGLEIITPGKLRMTVQLPPSLPVNEFIKEIFETVEAVDSLYSVLALIHEGRAEEVKRLISSFEESEGEVNSVLHEFLSAGAIAPLKLIRFHYGSDAITDILGIGKIMEILVSLRERWRKAKYEEEMLKEDVKIKRIETKSRELQLIRDSIAALREARDLQLSDKDLERLVEPLMSIAAPVVVPLIQNQEYHLTTIPEDRDAKYEDE